jgi:predicted DNA-binding ArsR family transcriptional regulator
MNLDAAEILALQAFHWLTEQIELMSTFLEATGILPSELAQMAETSEFMAAVLDFIMMEDSWVIALAQHLNIEPMVIKGARTVLPGGQQINWT